MKNLNLPSCIALASLCLCCSVENESDTRVLDIARQQDEPDDADLPNRWADLPARWRGLEVFNWFPLVPAPDAPDYWLKRYEVELAAREQFYAVMSHARGYAVAFRQLTESIADMRKSIAAQSEALFAEFPTDRQNPSVQEFLIQLDYRLSAFSLTIQRNMRLLQMTQEIFGKDVHEQRIGIVQIIEQEIVSGQQKPFALLTIDLWNKEIEETDIADFLGNVPAANWGVVMAKWESWKSMFLEELANAKQRLEDS